jgi:hypothetical protein
MQTILSLGNALNFGTARGKLQLHWLASCCYNTLENMKLGITVMHITLENMELGITVLHISLCPC